MRLQANQEGSHTDELKKISEWILSIGDGKVANLVDDIEKFEYLMICS